MTRIAWFLFGFVTGAWFVLYWAGVMGGDPPLLPKVADPSSWSDWQEWIAQWEADHAGA